MQDFKVNDKVCPWGDNRVGTVTALNEVAYWSQKGQTVTVVFEGDDRSHYFSPKELSLRNDSMQSSGGKLAVS